MKIKIISVLVLFFSFTSVGFSQKVDLPGCLPLPESAVQETGYTIATTSHVRMIVEKPVSAVKEFFDALDSTDWKVKVDWSADRKSFLKTDQFKCPDISSFAVTLKQHKKGTTLMLLSLKQ